MWRWATDSSSALLPERILKSHEGFHVEAPQLFELIERLEEFYMELVRRAARLKPDVVVLETSWALRIGCR